MSSPPITAAPASAETSAPDVVKLELPAAPRYLRLARLTAAGLAGDLGFDMESLEDLRVAVDELCAAAIDGAGDGAVLVLRYEPNGRAIRIEGEVAAPGSGVELHPVAQELLRMVADEYDLTTTGTGRSFWVRKEPRPVEADGT